MRPDGGTTATLVADTARPDEPSADRERRLHLITCEYPPQFGGVGDFTSVLASALAERGLEAQVWAPGGAGTTREASGIVVHRCFGTFGTADLERVGRLLDATPAPRTLFIQWVPHGFGRRAMNVAFCRWVQHRARTRGDQVDLMVHEPFLPFAGQSLRVRAASLVQRYMMRTLLHCATRVWVSTTAWTPRLQALGPRELRCEWMPVPSNIPVSHDPSAVAGVRARVMMPGGVLAGHFGTYSPVTLRMLRDVIPMLLADCSTLSILLLGRGSDTAAAELCAGNPTLASRIHGAGMLAPAPLSHHLQACELMLQPYPDGVTTRRTSMMAALAHGLPVVTTTGELTEAIWATQAGAILVDGDDTAAFVRHCTTLASSPSARKALADTAQRLYRAHFASATMVSRLSVQAP
jgi:glycosyltransferase involved in cell wall biosynthesis